ncbi:MAG: 3-oxoacyl-ACP reductase FabG [Parabacteroides sp.]
MSKKYALVTGGSRGIGRAVCVKLAQAGYSILINCVSHMEEAEKTLALVRQAGQEGEILRFDVCRSEQVTTALLQWSHQHPEDYIEVLVNNAGIRRDGILALMPEEDWRQVIHTTLTGFYNVTQAVLSPMLVHKQGRIINIASVSGLKGLPGQTNYAAAKGGLVAATKALALEVARKRVTVNAVAPGFIETDMTKELDQTALVKNIPLGRFGQPEEVAEVVAFLASPKAAYITGEVISINGGLYT